MLPAAIRRQPEPEVHFHVAVQDGVFTSGKGAARADFWRLPTPDRMDLETLTLNVEMRVVAWLRRRGFLDDDPDEPDHRSAARCPRVCGSVAMPCLRLSDPSGAEARGASIASGRNGGAYARRPNGRSRSRAG